MSRRLFGRLTRSRFLAQELFGARILPLEPGEHAFDATTLALRRRAIACIAPGARVLDVGTGSAAILGLWLWRRGCRVTCTELDPAIAARARAHVELNGAAVRVETGSFFAGLREPFDHVLFNPPYVPTGTGRQRALPQSHRTQWDGGPDGTDTIAAFVEAFAREGGSATALMGVNSLHVPRERVELLLQRDGLAVQGVWKHPWLPVHVYDFVRNQSPIASPSRPVE